MSKIDMDLCIGIHCGHDANVTVMDEAGNILFAAGEERFNRKKMFAGFPQLALQYVVKNFGAQYRFVGAPRMNSLDKIARELGFFYNSLRKKLMAPRFGIWLQKGAAKLLKGRALDQGISLTNFQAEKHYNTEHHHAHAATAFYPSGFDRASIITLDGEGDGYSCCIYEAEGDRMQRIHSWYHNEITVGRDYEKVTAMLGFDPIRHPGKVTGLAAYGHHNQPCIDQLSDYLKKHWSSDVTNLFDKKQAYQIISEEGRKELIRDRQTIFNDFTREDLAFAIQYLTETTVLELIQKHIPQIRGVNLGCAGGVFANVSLNKKIMKLGFKEIFIQPAMTDCGLSLGAILYPAPFRDQLAPFDQVFLGPAFSPDEIKIALEESGIPYRISPDPAKEAAQILADGKVLARFDGSMEFGPRALGNRSILYHAGDPSVNDWLNKRLKRSEFMPFAPVTLERFAADRYLGYESAKRSAKFMTITFDCTDLMKRESPAVVHVDGTARPQVLSNNDNHEYAEILEEYYRLTGIPTLVNTSFNMHEEPIVMTPGDAIRAYAASRIDAMLIGPYLLRNKPDSGP